MYSVAGPHHLHVLPRKALEFLLHPLDAVQQVVVLLVHLLVLLQQRLQLHLCLPRALQLQWVQTQVRELDGPTGGQATASRASTLSLQERDPGGRSIQSPSFSWPLFGRPQGNTLQTTALARAGPPPEHEGQSSHTAWRDLDNLQAESP